MKARSSVTVLFLLFWLGFSAGVSCVLESFLSLSLSLLRFWLLLSSLLLVLVLVLVLVLALALGFP